MARSADHDPQKSKKALSHELLHGLTPEEFNAEATALAEMEALTPSMRERLKTQLVERLKTPVDAPSWGPDWVRHGERVAAKNQNRPSLLTRLTRRNKRDEAAEATPAPTREMVLDKGATEDAGIIARNMEKSRQVAHYKPLYVAATVLATAIVLVSMFVDYHIIREIWTRALANEFMVVPDALKSSVVFKSLQVIFAVLIVHFMLKITGAYGRNTMIAASFIMALFMIAGLGYLVAYNNMAGGTATAREAHQTAQPGSNAIDQLFAPDNNGGVQHAAMVTEPRSDDGFSIGLPKLSETSLAHADLWFWLAFASVIFFIVTTVAALYMQTVENNVRNFHIAKDYGQRRKDFALLHLLELAEERG